MAVADLRQAAGNLACRTAYEIAILNDFLDSRMEKLRFPPAVFTI